MLKIPNAKKYLTRIQTQIKIWRRNLYLRTRTPGFYAPYPSQIYRSLLTRLSHQPSVEIVPFLSDSEARIDKINIFIRHDIDTRKCVDNIKTLLEIDRTLNIKAGVYFLANDESYSLREIKQTVDRIRDDGFEIGLHTACYLKDDYLNEFQRETEHFTHMLGFRPTSFTVHGVGAYRLDVRIQFMETIARSLWDFGYKKSDIPQLRSYDFVVHDSYLDDENRRFIYDDFIRLPPFFQKGNNYLIMTHPCYWKIGDTGL